MRILHITTIDTGGAYKAAYRLHESMVCHGIDSRIMVRTKLDPDGEAVEVFRTPVGVVLSKGRNGLNKLCSNGTIVNDRFGTDISRHPLVREADILFLHWVNSFLSCKNIMQLGKLGKTIVWCMHDMWLFTGGCHVDGYCGRYDVGCGRCPLIVSEKENDLSRKNFLDKENMMKQLEITVTGPSRWIVEQALKSRILSGEKVHYMPNVLDTTFYKPVKDKEELRKRYGINGQKKIILFGAADNGTGNENKGFRYLREAFRYLPVEKYSLMIFGNTESELKLPDKLEVVKMGYISEESKLVELYNLADVLVNPSSQESFGYTVCEAMSCGTPAVGFPIGGIKEQITHKVNGYLAKYHDAEDLARGIEFCCENLLNLGKAACQAAQQYSYSKTWYQGVI